MATRSSHRSLHYGRRRRRPRGKRDWILACAVCASTACLIAVTLASPAPALAARPPQIGNELAGLEREEVIPAAGQEYPIDLSTALRLGEGENPTIALGREAIREAIALQCAARAAVLPSLNAGVMYHHHQGALQGGTGQIERTTEESLYFGGGDWAVGAGTVLVPAVHLFGHVGDAYYAPLAAAQIVRSRTAASRGIDNTILLDVVRRYLDLLRAEAVLETVRHSEADLLQVVLATAAYAKTGQGRIGDFNRARGDALLLHAREQRVQEDVAVASSELIRILHLDPSIRLKTGAGEIVEVQLVDPSYRLDELIQIARVARPEATARVADVAAADIHLQQECVRPWLPVVSVGYSAGGFGGGPELGGPFQQTSTRSDFDVFAVWTLENLGLGNAALQKERRADRDEAIARRGLLLSRIGREVADAYARSEARRQEVIFARKRLATAREGAGEEINRTRAGEGLPLEAINSVDLLVEARRDLVVATIAYNLSQFELFVAIGQTPNTALPDPHKPASGQPNEH